MHQQRTIPDSAQNNAARERGRLKVFLGYAPGVGKTYAMLDAARQRQEEGVDVLVGYIDTHARADYEGLLRGLPVLARKRIVYADGAFTEMDLDGLLARRPGLATVGDLAHANATGSRHPQRFLDVEELLDAGIDVYATLNIQNLDSLKDIVERIAGITVLDTVPDRVLDEADEIELVDVPVAELVRRMQEGRVDVPPEAAGTLETLFRPGNLTALRELALRRAADRVDRQMRTYMRARSIPGPWPAGERVLVAVSGGPLTERLVRTGRRLAQALQAEWFVIHAETPAQARMSEVERSRVGQGLRLADSLGARTLVLPGQTVAGTILSYARQHNITKIVCGKPPEWGWRSFVRRNIADEIIAQSGDIDVHVVGGGPLLPARLWPAQPGRPGRRALPPYLAAALMVALITALGHLAVNLLTPANFVMLYLLPVIIAAVRWGLGPSAFAAVLSVLAFDFFFLAPTLTFVVSDSQYLLVLAGLLLVSLVVSTLAGREREQAEAARRRVILTSTLYDLSRDLARADGLDAVTQAVIHHVGATFGREVAVLLPEHGRLLPYATSPGFGLDAGEQAVAQWAYEHARPAGRGSDTLANAAGRYLPLQTAQGVVGVLSVKPPGTLPGLQPEQVRLLEAFAGQAALAVERAQLAQRAREVYQHEETERLQAALLNSISHDLRTPLASITGSLTTLLDQEAMIDPATARTLIETARDEAGRLNQFVGNLLEMTRVEAGAVRPDGEPGDIEDLIGAALAQMGQRLQGRAVAIAVPAGLPNVPMNFVAVTQALVNVLDNAVKYSPPETPLEIAARQAGDVIEISIADHGPGIPDAERERIFEKFYRVPPPVQAPAQAPAQARGTGLGLSISKGIVNAHGGRIWASNRPGGGAVFTITLPLGTAVPDAVQAQEVIT